MANVFINRITVRVLHKTKRQGRIIPIELGTGGDALGNCEGLGYLYGSFRVTSGNSLRLRLCSNNPG